MPAHRDSAKTSLQVRCVINACPTPPWKNATELLKTPILASVTTDHWHDALAPVLRGAIAALSAFPIASLGLNCATGPTEMAEHIRTLSRTWPRAISVMPNAGLPALLDGRAHFPLRPEPFAEAMVKFIERGGINLVGGCCGTTPDHIRALVRALDSAGHAGPLRRADKAPAAPACTSLYEPVEYRQDASILLIGERLNASGSRKFKQLLEQHDLDSMISLAREQIRDGSHVLDLNVDYAGRNGARDAAEIAHRVARQVNAPLMIDSTQPATIEAALKSAPGKCIINSANFEDGEEKFDALCGLAKRFGAALVIGSIDEDKDAAMARTADRKLSIAQRAHQRATRVHGLHEADLFFDPLVLPVSTGLDSDRRSALETIDGVRAIARELPNCQTTVGLSNVSFGLKPAARIVLNSVFMHELVEAGLTSAIVHASKILPRPKIADDQWDAAINLIYDRRAESAGGTGLPAGVSDESFDPLQAFIDLFKDATSAASAAQDDTPKTIEERLWRHIIDGEKQA
ncbi:MAG: dihydropteroate synthase [Phycisphaeraceae bacterium]|nr:dihydropteroate synthase [Phycisphaeraceae bacterium]